MTGWLRQHGWLVAAFSVGGSTVGVTDTLGPAGRPALIAALVAVVAIAVAGTVEVVKLRTIYCRATACAAADRAKMRQARAWSKERRRTYRKLVRMMESPQHVETLASLVSGCEVRFPPRPAGGEQATAAAQANVPAQASPPPQSQSPVPPVHVPTQPVPAQAPQQAPQQHHPQQAASPMTPRQHRVRTRGVSGR